MKTPFSSPGIFTSRNTQAVLFLLAICICNLLFHRLLGINEQDLLVEVKHFADPTWIPGDWYLSMDIGYRLLFNFLIGPFTRVLPLETVSIIWRLIFFLSFSLIIVRVCKILTINPLVLVPFMFIYIKNQGLFADEWMIGGVETKVFAYLFSLTALSEGMRKRFTSAALFSGLAVSFHILIGAFSSVCLFGAILTCDAAKDLFKGIWYRSTIFLLAASAGIFAFISYTLQSHGVDNLLAARIYALFRVAHHTIPFGIGFSFKTFILFVIAGFSVFLLFIFSKKSLFARKIGLRYTAVSIVFFLVGIIASWAGYAPALKYYLFRFPDVIVPLTLYFATAGLIDKFLINRFCGFRYRIFTFHLNPVHSAGMILGAVILVFSLYTCFNEGSRILNRNYAYIPESPEFIDMCRWINKNTAPSKVFLISPAMEYFYIVAQRPAFVTYKHFPQSDSNIIEWYRRITLCNGGTAPSFDLDKKFHFKIDQRFNLLNESEISDILKQYKVNYYLCRAGRVLNYPAIYTNNRYTLFKIEK